MPARPVLANRGLVSLAFALPLRLLTLGFFAPMPLYAIPRYLAQECAECLITRVPHTAARLGDDPKTVLSVYAHLLPSSDEEAAKQVAEQLTASSR